MTKTVQSGVLRELAEDRGTSRTVVREPSKLVGPVRAEDLQRMPAHLKAHRCLG